MTLNARDKKLVMILAPVLIVVAYWMLLLAPKREEAAQLGETLVQTETRRDAAQQMLERAERSKATYAEDYATVVRLGKAIPADVDLSSLIVQLKRAAEGTSIDFTKITAGERVEALVADPGAVPPGGSVAPAPAAEAGGAPAATGPGQATETANETADAAEESGAASADAAGSPPAETATTTTGAPAASAVPTLDTVPLIFTFKGRFGDLANFFHEMKRFVQVVNDGVEVDGRLMKIDGFAFDSSKSPLSVEVTATVYLAPKGEGTTAGATPEGPATTATTTTTAPPPTAEPPATPVAQGASQ